MRIEAHNVYDPDKLMKMPPRGEIEYNLDSTEVVLKYLEVIKPDSVEGYVRSLSRRLLDVVGEGVESPVFELGEKMGELPIIGQYPDLVKLIIKYTCLILGVPTGEIPEEIEVTSLTYTKGFRRLGYHRVKTLVEYLGEEGVPVYKEIVARMHRANRATLDDSTLTLEFMPQAIKNWTNSGLGDFTVAVLDDHRVLFRFDKCLVPEALNDFNDPDIAYLASCYTGDSPEFNPGRKRYMRRTQTLHHAPFCDEFYWDQESFPNAEQPTLRFTEKIGKKENRVLGFHYVEPFHDQP